MLLGSASFSHRCKTTACVSLLLLWEGTERAESSGAVTNERKGGRPLKDTPKCKSGALFFTLPGWASRVIKEEPDSFCLESTKLDFTPLNDIKPRGLSPIKERKIPRPEMHYSMPRLKSKEMVTANCRALTGLPHLSFLVFKVVCLSRQCSVRMQPETARRCLAQAHGLLRCPGWKRRRATRQGGWARLLLFTRTVVSRQPAAWPLWLNQKPHLPTRCRAPLAALCSSPGSSTLAILVGLPFPVYKVFSVDTESKLDFAGPPLLVLAKVP